MIMVKGFIVNSLIETNVTSGKKIDCFEAVLIGIYEMTR